MRRVSLALVSMCFFAILPLAHAACGTGNTSTSACFESGTISTPNTNPDSSSPVVASPYPAGITVSGMAGAVSGVGVAILTKPTMLDTRAKKGVIVKPLADTALCFETCLVLRAHEESRFVNEFVRSYLRKYAPHRLGPTQMELKLPA